MQLTVTTAVQSAFALNVGAATAMPILAVAAVLLVGVGLLLIRIGRKRGVR